MAFLYGMVTVILEWVNSTSVLNQLYPAITTGTPFNMFDQPIVI
jgi:hypothetical protein